MDPTVPSQVTDAINSQNSLGNELLDFAMELYYLRSAAVMSWRLRDDFDSISLATAVAASANFSPIFRRSCCSGSMMTCMSRAWG